MTLKRFFIFSLRVFLSFLALIFVINIATYIASGLYAYESVEDVPEVQTALILGAGVSSEGKLSPIFQNRVEKAVELYKAKKVAKILASGDNSTTQHNEVNPVRDYLLAKGIPDTDIFLDHAGFDTYSTMYRARDIFQVSSIVIVTQSFHLPRALFIARMLGIQAYGISADEGKTPVKNYIREIFANEKAAFNLFFHTKPKYLGDTIPISGRAPN